MDQKAFWEKTKKVCLKKYYKFREWFTDKNHPRYKLRVHDFLMDSSWFLGLAIIFSIIYANSQSLNEIVLLFIKLGSALQLVVLFFLVKKGYGIFKNLKYGIKGLNNGTKIILMIILIIFLLGLYGNQEATISSIKNIHNKTNFSTFNPIKINESIVNGTIIDTGFNPVKFTNFLPQPWGFLVFWGIVASIALILLAKFVFDGELPQWLLILLGIVAVVLLFNLHVPYSTVDIGDFNTYCDDSGEVKLKSNLFGMGGLGLSMNCLEYKSSRCRPSCLKDKPVCQCEAAPIHIMFSTEGAWILDGW